MNRSKSALSKVFMCERFHMVVDCVGRVCRKTCRLKSCPYSCSCEHSFRHHCTHCPCTRCTKVSPPPPPKILFPWETSPSLGPEATIHSVSKLSGGAHMFFNLMTFVVPFILRSVVALLGRDVLALCDSLAVVLLQLLR